MISQHQKNLVTTLSAVALLGWLAFEPMPEALADASRSAGYLDDARTRLQQADPQAAVIHLKNALQEDPGNIEARRLLGEIYLDQGRYPEAAKELRRVHEAAATPENAVRLGRALLGQGEADEALALIQGMGGAVGDQAQAVALIEAEALLNLERPADARQALAAAIDANPLNVSVSLMDARISLAESDLDAAKTKVARSLEIDQDSIPAWMLDTQIKSAEGRHEEALGSLDRLAELAPGNDRIKVMRAEVLIRRAKFDEAEQVVEDVLQRHPADVAANYLLATVQSNKGALAEADTTLRKIADVTRDVDEITLLSGVVKLGIGQNAQAETLLNKYITRRPDNLPVRRLLASLQLRQGSPRAAVDTLRPVAGKDSTDPISLQLKSSAEIRMGDVGAARETLDQLARLGHAPSAAQAKSLLSVLKSPAERLPSEEARLEMVQILDLMRNGQGDEALSAASRLAETHPENPLALNLYGMAHLVNDGEEAIARQLFDKAITLDPTYLDAHKNLDRLDIRSGRLDVLAARLEARIADGLDPEVSALELAQLQARQGKAEEALATLRIQADAQPESVLLRRALLGSAMRQGRREDSAAIAEELLALGDAGNPTAYSAAGDHFFGAGDYEAAVFAYTKLNQLKPDHPQLLTALAHSQYRAGDIEAARTSLEHIRSLEPKNYVANNSLVDLDIEAGRLDEAMAFAKDLEATAPGQAARLTSKILMAKSDGAEAIAVLEQALVETPSTAIARDLFQLRQKLGLDDEAILGLKSWIATRPDDVTALDMLGDAFVARQAYDAALPYFERAHQLTLNDPVLMNDLSWVRHELGRPGAEELARRAYQISQNPAISDTLGWILVKKGETEPGLRLLREAHQGLQDNPDIRFHLAYALHSQGDAEGAEALLQGLKDWPQPFMEREPALKLLEQIKGS